MNRRYETMIVAVIPAQGKSMRLPEKNMRKIDGQPLLYWSIEVARKSKKIEKIIVSTDNDNIAEYAKSQQVSVIMRDEALCGDAPVLDVYKDAIVKSGLEDITFVVAIQPDHPDRSTDIDAAIEFVLEKNISDFITTDHIGVRHGSVRIMKSEDLLKDRLSITSGAWVDNCINIHTEKDLRRAEASLIRKRRPLRIENFDLFEEGPTFIIAEAGANHNANLDVAKMMIDQAKEAGADAIKFQSYKAEKLVTRESKQYWKRDRDDGSQFQYYKTLDKFGFEDYRQLFEYCREKDIIFLTTPFDYEFTDFFGELGMAAFKIASCDLPDTSFVRHVASKGKPIILSTGASSLEEIGHAVDTILKADNQDIILLQCSLAYPTKDEDANLRQIVTLKNCFPEAIVGISDHTFPDESLTAPTAAVALGAKVVEKHYTFCRNQPTNSHQFSIDPCLLKRMVQNIRILEKVLGLPDIFISDAEKPARENARRSITAMIDIPLGTIISREMLAMKRPGTGLPPDRMEEVIGKKVKVSISEDSQIEMDWLE